MEENITTKILTIIMILIFIIGISYYIGYEKGIKDCQEIYNEYRLEV